MKKERLEARGLRFYRWTWSLLKRDGKAKGTSASDIGRQIIENHYAKEKPKVI